VLELQVDILLVTDTTLAVAVLVGYYITEQKLHLQEQL
jgi:hypothetical protein